MNIFKYPGEDAENKVLAIINRGLDFPQKAYQDVTDILDDVRKNGDKALINYTRKFDSQNVTERNLVVSEGEIDAAFQSVEKECLSALDLAIFQIESFHKKQLTHSWFDTTRPGVFLGQMVNPVDAAGIYVPGAQGGKTPLVSSVLMNGIPAKIAGVGKIVMVTPPMADGCISPYLLVAAKKVGVDLIVKAGSAWAIAALAYGTKQVPKVDVITGPGNMYVTLAKKIVAGTVGIDMIAGPSEILVIADETANPSYMAADLLSQAEHDALASAILVTTSREIADQVSDAVDNQLKSLSRKNVAEKSLADYGVILVVPDMETAISLANKIAPEHLELQVADPFACFGRLKNAGAIFMGQHTPEPVGDYIAGPNHVLPTAGTARFSSALSVDNFLKKTSVIHYSEDAFRKEAGYIIRLADIEGLSAHANSVKIRLA
ncbi:MAG: histidinol dehydrogenase [Proteobacteria bacterium]|nr:histidinol dehydrogenase [Pseudomonadota bacterium]